MSQLFKNNARSTLAAPLASGGMSLTLQTADAAKFPAPTGGDFFDLTLQDATNVEIVRVTGRSAGVLTLSARQLEGTTSPATFAIGTVVGIRLTAAVVESTLAHVADTDAAHAASAIANTPSGNLAATTVQAALNELQADVDSRATGAALTSHIGGVDAHPGYVLDGELTAGLAGKSNTGHTHASGDVSGLGTAAAADTGTGSGNVPVIGATSSSTELLAGLLRLATRAQAEGGSLDDVGMTPLKTAQAIAALAAANGAYRTVQIFSTAGSHTYTKPAGLKRAKVTVVAAGGGAGDLGGGAGGGGASIKTIEAASIGSTETVTIGAGGVGDASTGAAGGTSSFGAHCSATGGAASGSGSIGGAGGVGSGGDININGSGGSLAIPTDTIYGGGGASFLGGASRGATGTSNGNPGLGYGGGGGSCPNGRTGGTGGTGIIIVEEFY